MNLVDLGVLAVLVVSGLLGLSRGVVRELLGLGAWVLAGLAAWTYHAAATPLMLRLTADTDIAEAGAYVVVFVVVLIALSLAANLVGRIVRVSALGGLDRTLGFVFGLGRGAALLVAAYIALGLMLPAASWPPALRRARTIPLIHDGAEQVAARIPERFRPKIAPPPEPWSGDADALMRATPQGSATGGHATGGSALGPGTTRD